ncbi:MAG: response regulator transcription factor [Thermomicrobiales bacterium]
MTDQPQPQPEPQPIRIVIADDHALFRDGVRSLLEAGRPAADPGEQPIALEVVGEARNGAEAIALARSLRPDIVLMDLMMPGTSGLEATRAISAELPDVKVVVLTASEDDADLFEAVKSGAQGYLSKNLEASALFTSLAQVVAGETAFSPLLARKVLGEFARQSATVPAETVPIQPLTDREREVLELLVRGVTSNRDLADQLYVSPNTVKYHLRNILDKLHLNNRSQVIAYAIRSGLVDLPS